MRKYEVYSAKNVSSLALISQLPALLVNGIAPFKKNFFYVSEKSLFPAYEVSLNKNKIICLNNKTPHGKQAANPHLVSIRK